MTLEEGDVLFVISNWPCGKNTIEQARFCHQRGIPIILLTNSSVNPIARFCDIMLDSNSVNTPCLLLPAILIIESISFDLARKTAPQSTQYVEELEKMLKEKELLVW